MNSNKLKRYTSDCIPYFVKDGEYYIYLIERKNKPFGYAIPGGFRDPIPGYEYLMEYNMNIPKALFKDEHLEDPKSAAIRELKEELDLTIKEPIFLGFYDELNRDPRGYTVSHVFFGEVEGEPEALDDAKSFIEVPLVNLDNFIMEQDIAFDHADILLDFKKAMLIVK